MKKYIFGLFIALFVGIIFSGCNKDTPISPKETDTEEETVKPKEDTVNPEEKKEYSGKWEAVEFTYTLPNSGGNTHTWEFSKLTDGCNVDLIEINKEEAKLFVSNKHDKDVCRTKVVQGKLDKGIIIFEGEEDKPRTILASSKGYLKLRYKFTYDKYPHMECDVLYKRVDSDEVADNGEGADNGKMESKHVGNWAAKEFTVVYTPSYKATQQISMLLPTQCADYSVDALSINENATVELKFYRLGSCEPKVYKGKIEGNIIIFDEDKDNPRTIVSNDGMFLDIKYAEDKFGDNDFTMRFEKK